MDSILQLVFKSVLACYLLVAASVPAAEKEDEARAAALANVRTAAAARDMAAVREKLAVAGNLKGAAEFDAELLRLEELCDYLEKFWQSVDKGAKTLDGTEELLIGEERVAFVEYENGTLVLRVKGENRSFNRSTLPAKIALTLSQKVMKPEAAANKVFFGAFLVLDAKGDVDLARKAWKEAADGGVDVKRLLPELDAERPLPPVEIPQLTPELRDLLTEKNWSFRVKGEKGWTRKPLDKRAVQNSEGRLEVKISADESDTLHLIAKKPLTGNFVVRAILTNIKKGQTLGLFAADTEDEGFVVELPAGTYIVEFGRLAGKFKCKVGDKMLEVQSLGKAAPRMTGVFGLSIPAGAQCTVAAVKFTGR